MSGGLRGDGRLVGAQGLRPSFAMNSLHPPNVGCKADVAKVSSGGNADNASRELVYLFLWLCNVCIPTLR